MITLDFVLDLLTSVKRLIFWSSDGPRHHIRDILDHHIYLTAELTIEVAQGVIFTLSSYHQSIYSSHTHPVRLVELLNSQGQRHPVELVELVELVEVANITGPETPCGTGGTSGTC